MTVFNVKKNKLRTNRGIALFIAMVISGVALVIGAGVLEISAKEIQLSSVGRESVKAFYAADTGLECALYWDDVTSASASSVFATSTDSLPLKSAGSNLNCANTDISKNWTILSTPPISSTAATTTFTIDFSSNNNDPCADVTVVKYKNSSGRIVTKIESRGLNSCNTLNKNRSERGMSITY